MQPQDRNDMQYEPYSPIMTHQREKTLEENAKLNTQTTHKKVFIHLSAFERTALISNLPIPFGCRHGTTVCTTSIVSP